MGWHSRRTLMSGTNDCMFHPRRSEPFTAQELLSSLIMKFLQSERSQSDQSKRSKIRKMMKKIKMPRKRRSLGTNCSSFPLIRNGNPYSISGFYSSLDIVAYGTFFISHFQWMRPRPHLERLICSTKYLRECST